MNRELADLQDLKSAFISHCKTLGCEDNYIKVCESKFDRIEASINIQKKMVESLQSSKEHLIDDLEKLERENFELSERVGFNATYKGEDEDKLKALDIIKEKVSDMKWLKYCSSLEQYNEGVPSYEQLTQEEFDILKEALSNE